MDHYRLERFHKSFNISSADVLRIGGVTFVTLNSMAMENDGCNICQEAVNRINKIAGLKNFDNGFLKLVRLNLIYNLANISTKEQPILLQVLFTVLP